MVLSILLAWAHPEAGIKNGPLAMQITGKWVAVCLIFFLSGLKLKTTELVKVISSIGQNSYVQFNIFVTFPFVAYLILLIFKGSVSKPLLDGTIILGCLPSTISMSFVLCATAGANEVISVINAALCNFIGVLITPALILLFLGDSANVDFLNVLFKLSIRVFVPIFFGQILRYSFKSTQPMVKKYKRTIKHISTIALVYTVYGSFCQMFHDGVDADASDFLIVVAICLLLHLVFLVSGFLTSGLFGWNRMDRVAILFCTTQKTAAMGIPLINTMFETDDNLGLYQVPLLIYHPLQLLVASLLMFKIVEWIENDPRKPSISEQDETNASEIVCVRHENGETYTGMAI